MTTPNIWTIHPAGVSGGRGKLELVGCHIAISSDGTAYEFKKPGGHVVARTEGTSLPELPFAFPVFRSKLAGSDERDWQIGVFTFSGGRRGDEAQGTWQIVSIGSDPPDTWVAQAGSGLDVEASAASA